MATIQLGDKVKDMVTGFEGICVARTQWLNGCVRVMVQSDKLDKDGKPQDAQAFDEPQMVITKAGKVVTDLGQPEPVVTRPGRTGGPAPKPQQRPDAKR